MNFVWFLLLISYAAADQREYLEKQSLLSEENIESLVDILQNEGRLIQVYESFSISNFKNIVDKLPMTDHVKNQLCHIFIYFIEIDNIDMMKYVMNEKNTSPTCIPY